MWAKGQPPALGAGHQVSSILTTPTSLISKWRCSSAGEHRCYIPRVGMAEFPIATNLEKDMELVKKIKIDKLKASC